MRFDDSQLSRQPEVALEGGFGWVGEGLESQNSGFEWDVTDVGGVAVAQPAGPFGRLVRQIAGGTGFEYPFTADDVVWLARFIKGEAGGRDDSDSHAVAWAMFNRYALYAHKHWPTLAAFLRAYSTTLQPHLVNPGAVERAIQYSRDNPATFKWVQWGTFPHRGRQIPKGQLQHHLDLQRARWSELPASLRALVERLAKGAIPNPIGLASEFANTLTFLRGAVKKAGRDPKSITVEEWRDYTREYARRQKRKWIGDRPGLDQMRKNAFFIDSRSVGLPEDAVRVAPPVGGSTSPGDGSSGEVWEAFDDRGANRAGEVDTDPLVLKRRALRNWSKLLLMKVSDDVQKTLTARKMRVQYAHNESYSNDLNFDLYPVRINRFPNYGGVRMMPATLIKYVRLNINTLLDTSISKFTPYSAADAALWATDNPVGAVIRIDIRPDNAAVVVSSVTPNGWTFTTVETPATGNHPVSGHRNFFITTSGSVHYFAVKGLDMTSSGIAGLGLPIGGEYGYRRADKLWLSLQKGLTNFINSNGGDAKPEKRYSERLEWRFVYREYVNALERVFGKGAGSARNSPFFDIFN